LSWRSILKESKTTSREIVNLNWDEEQLPDKDKDTCIKELRRMVEKAKNHPVVKETETRFPNPFMGEMPETVACRALGIIKQLGKDTDSLSDMIDGHYIISSYKIDGFGVIVYPEKAFHKPTVFRIFANNPNEKYTFEELDWR